MVAISPQLLAEVEKMLVKVVVRVVLFGLVSRVGCQVKVESWGLGEPPHNLSLT